MKIIIKNATIIDSASTWNNKVVDIQIENGIIKKIGRNISLLNGYDILSLENLHVSRGWFDSSVCFGEPGFEDSETIANGLNVAAKSGFTAVVLQPNSYPVIDNQSQIKFVKSKAAGFATQLLPIGALTKNSEGKDLAELFDMNNSGAVAFGDYKKSLNDANLLKIALQYVQDFDGLIIAFAEDTSLKSGGIVNEGEVALRLGLKGIATLAEEMHIARNLSLLEYTGGKLHIPTISSSKSVALIKIAKSEGLSVSCSVAVHNLVLSDEMLVGFDTRFKVSPPLRSESDRVALINAVLDGTIDMITSDHNPVNIEQKKTEFDLAKDGTIGLESAFGSLLKVLPLQTIIDKFTLGKGYFCTENQTINKNCMANLTFFNPEPLWTFEKQNILSMSKNSAFLGSAMQGKVYGIFNQDQLILS